MESGPLPDAAHLYYSRSREVAVLYWGAPIGMIFVSADVETDTQARDRRVTS